MSEAFAEVLRFAFEENRVFRLTTGCDPENKGSEKVMKKCGLVKEADMKKKVWMHGKKMCIRDSTNYIELFKDKLFGIAFKNTLFYTVFNVLFTMIISFLLAVFLNRNQWITKFARSCMYIPYVTSMVVAAMIWLWMYEPHGLSLIHI